jgi:hypothetical protein
MPGAKSDLTTHQIEQLLRSGSRDVANEVMTEQAPLKQRARFYIVEKTLRARKSAESIEVKANCCKLPLQSR